MRDRNGANETPPMTPKPQAKPSEADIKRFKDIEAKRNKARRGKGGAKKPDDGNEKPSQGGAAGATADLHDFFENLQEVTAAVGLVTAAADSDSPVSQSESWVCVMDCEGKPFECEQIVCRPPVGFRKYDERGVEILWLMLSPLYGQSDSGAI